MKAQHQSQTTLITMEDAGAVLAAHAQQQLETQTEANKMKGADYLAENAKKEGVSVTESGLQYSVITQGDGAKPGATDQVTVHYRGTLIDGTEFDSSYSRGEPATFGLNQVIPGWTEGVQLMNVGSKYLFVVPYQLGYGERGAGGAIGPFETLIFEVELIEIKS
jgi:FKBP-type peptidyl-prolyl cis-trans isomerase